jgi:putative phosphoribosyl transferase
MFLDRADAGERLAEAAAAYRRTPGGLVLGLPRGGVETAFAVSRRLELPLGVFLSRKLPSPYQPELALGAVAETGELVLEEGLLRDSGLGRGWAREEAERQLEEIARRQRLYRGREGPPDVSGRVVVLVDDGVATGATFLAALRGLRGLGPARVVAALPVGPPPTLRRLAREADELLVLERPEPFGAVGAFYREFPQLSDERVLELLEAAQEARR